MLYPGTSFQIVEVIYTDCVMLATVVIYSPFGDEKI